MAMDEDYRDIEPSRDIERLLEVMMRLRDPETGCSWDQKQTFDTIAPYTIEEAYEVKDAIDRKDMPDLCDELGDLLLQVVYHAEIAKEQGAFDFGDVVEAINRKMIRRHPHVFGAEEQKKNGIKAGEWERIKAVERAEKAALKPEAGEDEALLLDSVPATLPALSHAMKLQKRASTVGFDWNDIDLVFDKLREEFQEFEAEQASGDHDKMQDELGDVLFVAVNLARHLKIDPEAALAGTNRKFIKRFNYIERQLKAKGRGLSEAGLDELEGYWIEAKSI